MNTVYEEHPPRNWWSRYRYTRQNVGLFSEVIELERTRKTEIGEGLSD
jgi:hypothetical protein